MARGDIDEFRNPAFDREMAYLAQQAASANQGSRLGGLASILLQGMRGWEMGKDKRKRGATTKAMQAAFSTPYKAPVTAQSAEWQTDIDVESVMNDPDEYPELAKQLKRLSGTGLPRTVGEVSDQTILKEKMGIKPGVTPLIDRFDPDQTGRLQLDTPIMTKSAVDAQPGYDPFVQAQRNLSGLLGNDYASRMAMTMGVQEALRERTLGDKLRLLNIKRKNNLIDFKEQETIKASFKSPTGNNPKGWALSVVNAADTDPSIKKTPQYRRAMDILTRETIVQTPFGTRTQRGILTRPNTTVEPNLNLTGEPNLNLTGEPNLTLPPLPQGIDPGSQAARLWRKNDPESIAVLEKIRSTSKADVQRETEKKERLRTQGLAYKQFNIGMDNLNKTMMNISIQSGPLLGLVPAVTADAQIAESALAAMSPILKQLFREAGEGVFTDDDRRALMNMLPKRTDKREAIAAAIMNVKRLVAAKLGMPIPDLKVKPEAKKTNSNAPIDSLRPTEGKNPISLDKWKILKDTHGEAKLREWYGSK